CVVRLPRPCPLPHASGGCRSGVRIRRRIPRPSFQKQAMLGHP
ncbi:MAG: hypothetical protein AVDCRST_MAG59-2014, partial [uncultured Thermomicrobiales bacterium]